MNNVTSILLKQNSVPATSIDHVLLEHYKGKSCAVVGSSGAILDHEYGEIIDQHDVVMRCNQAPTAGFEKSVGSRTDVRIINSHYFTALKGTSPPSHANFIPRMKSIFTDFDENYLYSLENNLIIVKYGVNAGLFSAEIERIKEKNNTILFLNSQFYEKGSHLVGTHATNGFIGILLALKYFDKVSCFGFTFCKEMKTPTWEKLYYWAPTQPIGNDCHNNDKEKEVVEQLAANGVINFYLC